MLKLEAVNLDSFSISFQNYLGSSQCDEDLIVRRMKDDAPNVIINLDDTGSLQDIFPKEHEYFEKLNQSGFHYILISMDF